MTYVSSYDWITQALRLSFCPGSMLTYSGYNLAYQLVLFFFFNIFLCDGTFEFLKEGINVEVTENTSTGLKFVANGTVNDAVNGNIEELVGEDFDANDSGATFELKRGSARLLPLMQ